MSATAATPEAAAQLLFPPNVQYNNGRLYIVKFLSSSFAGAVAGVLGLENTLGFALFIFSTLLTSSSLYLKCKGRPDKYVPGGWWELVNPGQENIFSFVLVWTLFYGTPIRPLHASSSVLDANRLRTTQELYTVRSQRVIGLSGRYQWKAVRSLRLNHGRMGGGGLLSGCRV